VPGRAASGHHFFGSSWWIGSRHVTWRDRHPFAGQWNHNSHYYPLIRSRIPDSARRVLDVGCGDGTLCGFIRRSGRLVVGVDVDGSVVPASHQATGGPGFALADAQRLCFADGTFDAVTAVMVLHHGDTVAAVHEAVRVLAPGGVLVVLGYADSDGWRDVPYELRDLMAHRIHARRVTAWHPRTAIADPARTWAQERALLGSLLPGSTFRRLPMWRYLVDWCKPD
jgi:SAM-dependent methyltransferase